MTAVSSSELRRLTAALLGLGLECPLHWKEEGINDLVLHTLLRLKYVIEPPRFSCREGDASGSSSASCMYSDPTRAEASAAVQAVTTSDDRLQLLQQIAAFMLHRTGIELDLTALFMAGGAAVSELRRLAETLSEATKASLETEANRQSRKESARSDRDDERAVDTREAALSNSEISGSRHLSKSTAETVQSNAENVIDSLQRFFGEGPTAERRAVSDFLQAVLTPEGSAEGPCGLRGRALLEHQLQQCRIAVAEGEGRNEALASQLRELKEKIRAAETDADRLNKQLLLLQGSQGTAVGAEEKQQQEMQEKLRQLYLEYARRSALCDTLMASVEDMASRAEAAAAQNRCRLQEARQRLLLEQAAGASGTETQTNCLDTLCGGISEDMGITLATSEQLCTEGSELDLAVA